MRLRGWNLLYRVCIGNKLIWRCLQQKSLNWSGLGYPPCREFSGQKTRQTATSKIDPVRARRALTKIKKSGPTGSLCVPLGPPVCRPWYMYPKKIYKKIVKKLNMKNTWLGRGTPSPLSRVFWAKNAANGHFKNRPCQSPSGSDKNQKIGSHWVPLCPAGAPRLPTLIYVPKKIFIKKSWKN